MSKLVKEKKNSTATSNTTMSNRLTCKKDKSEVKVFGWMDDNSRLPSTSETRNETFSTQQRGNGIMLLMLPRLEHRLLWSGGKRLSYFKPLGVSLPWSSIY